MKKKSTVKKKKMSYAKGGKKKTMSYGKGGKMNYKSKKKKK